MTIPAAELIKQAQLLKDDKRAQYCPCCKDVHHPDEFAPNEFHHSAALRAKYGRDICVYCSDDHTVCENSGVAVPLDDAVKDENGNCFATYEDLCASHDEHETWIEEEEAHERFERTY